ncbi:DUF1800 domain-containing protein [Neorhizobium sp. NCHU2750]|uniref:DUF1800 domain-containing protein n=1 Tax=Neorhizobium sp. NCHU2750 TaxID=1825976 RepID=UPI000E711E46|nr:hypothetical protein NCHU2750_16460 [Neorhizobium sp. NCHU2750]
MALERPTLAAIRYGYGLRAGQDMPDDADGLIAQVKRGVMIKPRFPREGVVGRREAATKVMSLRAAEAKAAQEGKPNESIRKETQREAQRLYRIDAMSRLAQAVQSRLGFHERLASFWMNHFAVSTLKSLPMRMIVPMYEAEAIRPRMAGSFSDLLKAGILHPAMLIYLDQNQSVGPDSVAGRETGRGLNENLGRELLELHTLGAGSGYSQDDVRAAALILTGLTVDSRGLDIAYRSRLAQAGSVTLLGHEYRDDEGGSQDHVLMLEDLAARPETALHISRKLAAHFISDDPPADVVAQMVAAWQKSDGDLVEVYRAMLEHPLAWENPGQKIKQPFEFVVSGFRALDMPDASLTALLADMDGDEDAGPVGKAMQLAGDAKAAEIRQRRSNQAHALTLKALGRMGEPVWQPPSPAGFADTASAWLAPGQLGERIAWARLAARTLAARLEPADFLDAALADAATPETRDVISQAPSRLHGLTMVLASAEFNRR